jgi:CBS-domain-containing membrane protein
MDYLKKMKGTTQSPPRVSLREIGWSWLGSLLGIAVVGYLNDRFFEGSDFMLIIGSLGASAVLIFGAIKSPLAQPPNLMGGHLISAIIGVSAYKLFHPWMWLAAAVAVATAIAAMHATKTLHPPGGATALIAVIGGDKIHNLGYLYVLMPVTAGAAILLIVALIFNNIPKTRKYPEFWI